MNRLVPRLVVLFVTSFALVASGAEPVRRLSVKDYRDKMKAGWIGQIIGVAWGAPTEFTSRTIIPADKVPKFSEDLVNQSFGQDDLYVEMTFLRTLEQYGPDVSIRQAGIDFANTRYPLWAANAAGRRNMRMGIAPPDSGHPKFNQSATDIDYQIEADYAGLISPGMPQTAIELGDKFGRLVCYGDGVYAGQFISAMYSEAFFESDINKLIAFGLTCIPEESMYAEMVRDMVRWHSENPNDWQKTWQLAEKKYNQDKNYNLSELDVKREGAWVLMGLLYGNGELDPTMVISCRCGFDSDCNPSSSGGLLFTMRGLKKIPDRYYKRLDETTVFSNTEYNFPALMAVCEKLARQNLVRYGGRIERDASGDEVFAIPVRNVRPSAFDDVKKAGPIADSRFTPEEKAQLIDYATIDLQEIAPGWKISQYDAGAGAVLRRNVLGKKIVYATEPLDRNTPCVLSKSVDVPAGKETVLRLTVGRQPWGQFLLMVRADGKELLRKSIDPTTAPNNWITVEVDLTPLAGKTVALELQSAYNNSNAPTAGWAEIVLESR